MEKVSIVFDVFEGDGHQNYILHAADMFEEGKELANYQQFQIDVEVDGDPDYNFLIQNMKDSFESSNRNVVFVSIRSINGKLVNNYPPYIKKGVKSISNGRRFDLFNILLAEVGYKVDVNDDLSVENATLIIKK